MNKQRRDAIVALAATPYWIEYENEVREFCEQWRMQALTPGTPYDKTEGLRLALGLVDELLALPEQAARAAKENDDE